MSNKSGMYKPDPTPEHERPLGRLLSEATGDTFFPLKSLEEAKVYEDGVAILQGDDGGQIYVVCLAAQVVCSELTLSILLQDLDEIAWPENYPDMRRIYYERRPVGTGIGGGMGGAAVTTEPWIHQEFVDLGLASAIQEVIWGKRERLR